MNTYVPLRNFTNFSIGESIIKIEDLAHGAASYGISAVGLCNRMNLFGVMDFSYYLLEKRIKPVIGCLLKIRNDNKSLGFMAVFVKNPQGYIVLSNLLSNAYIDSPQDPMVELLDLITAQGIIVLTGDHEGHLYHLISRAEYREAREFLECLQQYLGNNLYIEVSTQWTPDIQQKVIEQAYALDIALVGTHNTFFCHKEDAEAALVFQCIHKKEFFEEESLETSVYRHNYLLSDKEIRRRLPPLEELIDNTNQIAKRCSFIIEKKPQISPTYFANSEEDSKVFRETCMMQLNKLMEGRTEEEKKVYYQRLEMESKVICDKEFSGYFLIVADFIQWAKSQGIPIGAGRGSAAGALTAYLLNICGIDPIPFGLIFERFLNPERTSMPDFDLDFCQERREEVIDYVSRKYGFRKVAHIITFGSMKARMAIRDVGRTLKMPYGLVFKITSMVPTSLTEKITIASALESNPLFQEFVQDGGKPIHRLITISQKLEGLVRQPSSHASGIVINSKEDISHTIPLFRDAHGAICTQFNMNDIEKVGLIKFDFLGLKTLTVVDNCMRLVKKHHGVTINLDKIPLDNRDTYELIKSTEVTGVFQLESSVMRHVINLIKPDNINELAVLMAIGRPGPMKEVPKYSRRKRGQEPVEYLVPSLRNILGDTFGILVFQEQAMEIARVLAGFSYGRADLLRRAMGKKKPEEMAALKDEFIQGCKKNGISEKLADNIWHLVESFADYAFNKSHAVTYGWLSYMTAWLKKHYPTEFFCASMNSELDKSEKLLSFVYNIKHMGISIVSPNVNYSQQEFSIQNNSIIYGIEGIKGIGKQIAKEIVNNSPYKNLHDFLNKNNEHLNKKIIEQLVFSGALDTMMDNRRKCLETCMNFHNKNMMMESILDGESITDFSPAEKLELERKAFGFFLSYHPSQMLLRHMNIPHMKTLNYIPELKERYHVVCMIETIIKRKSRSEKGGVFAFISFSDHTDFVEMMVFSQVLNEYAEYIEENNLVVVQLEAWKSLEENARTTVRSILSISAFLSNHIKGINITVNNSQDLQKAMLFVNDLDDGFLPVMISGKKQKKFLSKKVSIHNLSWDKIPTGLSFI